MQGNLALDDDTLKQAERLVAKVGLPARPQAVVDINFELAQPHPDFASVAELLGSDPALTAKTLRLVNSALFGPPKTIVSIKQAVNLLGIDNLYNIVIAAALEEALQVREDDLNQKFWNHSLLVARTAELVAKRVGLTPEFSSQAYLAGLFHDCALPLFRKRFEDYGDLVERCLAGTVEAVEEENRRYQTDHCVVGYLVAHAWSLPAAVSEAIWFHHESGLEMHTDPLCRTLKAVLLLADYFSTGGADDELFWAEEHGAVLAELNLDVEALKDLREEAHLHFGGS